MKIIKTYRVIVCEAPVEGSGKACGEILNMLEFETDNAQTANDAFVAAWRAVDAAGGDFDVTTTEGMGLDDSGQPVTAAAYQNQQWDALIACGGDDIRERVLGQLYCSQSHTPEWDAAVVSAIEHIEDLDFQLRILKP